MRPLCFLLENLILALAASKIDIFLTGCGKLLLNYFYPGTMSRGAPLSFRVVQIRRRKGQQVCGQPESLCRSRDAQAAPRCCTRWGLSVLESPHSRGKEPNSHIVGFYTAETVPIADSFSLWLLSTAGFGRGGDGCHQNA